MAEIELNWHWKARTLIMGIVNITPDSFYDGGKYFDRNSAIKRVYQLIEQGADIIDIGAESSRPGAEPLSLQEELNRLEPVLEEIKNKRLYEKVLFSIDTYKSQVAKAAFESGFKILNDISGLRFDPKMIEVVREYNPWIIIMHMKGEPKTMQIAPHYEDVVNELLNFFKERLEFLKKNGVETKKVIIDPGIGFGKRQEDNIEILRNLDKFKSLGYPLLIGHSRKSLIGYLTGRERPEERLYGTLGLSAYLMLQKVDIIRVHDVEEHYEISKVLKAFIK